MVTVAIDGMGGDFAPLAVVRGAETAVKESSADIVLVGDEMAMKPLMSGSNSRIRTLHAPVFVGMDESPSSALRKKRDSSINKAFELLKNHEVQAVVSAGNSGASMGFAIFTLGRLPGVDRPSIATLHPNAARGMTVLLDSGGNVDCKSGHLVQFALMGDAFAKCALGIDSPRVGILSNAEEETKGNELTREAHALVRDLVLNYVGYIEGTDIYNGNADVVVSDGFVGNVALKVAEGAAEALTAFFNQSVSKSIKGKIGAMLLKDAFRQVAARMDYAEIGGAPLLGVDGVCIICHGKSTEKAIKNAVTLAKGFVEKDLTESIKTAMQTYQSLQKTKER
jgi:glycerol-3-phosphate acyltransferase PlsX